MKRPAWLALLAASTLLAHCKIDRYAIEMKPVGDAFERRLTCWTEDEEKGKKTIAEFSRDKLGLLAKAYPKRLTPEDAEKHVFAGEFKGATPYDVGGAGSLTRFVTQMGQVHSYVERFGGQDDLARNLERSEEAANRLTDLLIGWLRSELGTEPGFEKLREFCDEGLRRDIRNLSVYLWLMQVASGFKEGAGEEMIVRAAQYLVERDYFKPESAPSIARMLVYERGRDDHTETLSFFRRLVASRMGIAEGGPLPESFGFLSDPEQVKRSLGRYIRGTDEFKVRLMDWEERRREKPGEADPEPKPGIEDEILESIGFGLLAYPQRDVVEVKLACPIQPFATNGTWDEATGQVSWSSKVEEDKKPSPRLPVVDYASWSLPDTEFQQTHFGRIALEGENLAEYILWRLALVDSHGKEWDGFLAGLKPGPDLEERVGSFRFSDDPPEKSLADVPREAILKGLEDRTAGEKPDPPRHEPQ